MFWAFLALVVFVAVGEVRFHRRLRRLEAQAAPWRFPPSVPRAPIVVRQEQVRAPGPDISE